MNPFGPPADGDIDPAELDRPFRLADCAPVMEQEPTTRRAIAVRHQFLHELLPEIVATMKRRLDRLEEQAVERRRRSLKVIEGGKP
jgi:hypothetical protein